MINDDSNKSLPENGGSASGTSGDLVNSMYQARLQRAWDYQSSSLAKSDVLAANVGSLNGGLIRIAIDLERTIEQAMGSGLRTVDGLQKVLPGIDMHLRVTRQIDRFAQLELRAEELRLPTVSSEAIEAVDDLPHLPEPTSEEA